MNQMIDLASARRSEALQTWAHQCRADMKMRWPTIEFDGDTWPLKTEYKTRIMDARFERVVEDFRGRDQSYVLAYRCLIAHLAIKAEIKTIARTNVAWRLLKAQDQPLALLRRTDLVELEAKVLQAATPASSQRDLSSLWHLGHLLNVLASKHTVGHMAWSPSADTREELNRRTQQRRKAFRKRKAIDILDRQIEGLSDATAAMLNNDPRLNGKDCSALAAVNILMCAPARINEPLCMEVTGRIKVADYVVRPEADKTGNLFQAHQLLLMKGSKGADWSGKPILNFMVGLVEACWQVMLNNSWRSRMLLKHYERNPDQLFLTPELERLRGKPIDQLSLWQIANLSNRAPLEKKLNAIRGRGPWGKLVAPSDGRSPVVTFQIDNPRTHTVQGWPTSQKKLIALPWGAVEEYLLKKVHERMARMRKVSSHTTYEGLLSEMLMLVDSQYSPYLPDTWDASALRGRFKNTPSQVKQRKRNSVFEKLGLKMTVNGQLIDCYIEPHDTRRWLTTQALQARERLSDVLINKWANRLSVSQLAAYDLRSDEQKAEQSAIPVPRALESLSKSITELQGLAQTSGLKTEFISVHGDGLAVTDMQALEQFAEDRPAARCGSEILIVTPTKFGACLHQHTETPCRSYSNCDRCSKQATCKGHLPTNDAWRERKEKTNRIIYFEVERHIKEHNRQVADDAPGLEAHLLAQVRGLDARSMTHELIERFHEIKDRIRDPNFKRRLEQAYVAHNIVVMLDDPQVPDGTLITYNNPGMHEAPGHERAMEAQLGDREERQQKLQVFYGEHPELAPRPLGLTDQRTLLLGVDDDEDESVERGSDAGRNAVRDDDEQAA